VAWRDVLVGTPVAGRGHAELEQTIGFFVNTLVLRSRLDPGQTVAERLDASRSGSQMQISCSIKVSLATYPGNSMKAFYTGGASMAVGASQLTPSSSASLYGELIAGAAAGAKQQITNSYLSRQ